MTELTFTLRENSIDSLNEALDKFQQGQDGNVRALKFSILFTAQFIELLLKQYLISIDPFLVYTKCFREIQKKAKTDKVDIRQAYETLKADGFDFNALVKGDPNPHTVALDDALGFARLEMCSITGGELVDNDFADDISWLKQLRNNIEHFEFTLTAQEVRLCIGRIVRAAIDFCETFSLMDLADEIGKERFHTFEMLADEYTQHRTEAKAEMKRGESDAFRGLRPKEWQFVEWNVYRCDACGEHTMVPDDESATGYKCKMPLCGNEESEDIEVPCDVCGVPCANGDMQYWDEGLPNVCPQCNSHSD
ncbi:hypothetical protein CFter6_1685 [Collimonas fungivorans]|uniref:Uncharacterized protein n=1 Tax=Collimonas fungivorans TaxID=158899 RepID=A0A127P9E7_9BURK|nr:hypothetical protein [Collimonas fungivorans]AMO94387.1 hypothetical protein CFter6_1685 [Collimonas fungivorans]